MIVIEWLEGSAKGFEDLFSPSSFEQNGESRQHSMRHGPSGDIENANYNLHTQGARAELTYLADVSNKVVPGIYRFVFSGPDRTELKDVVWTEDSGYRLSSREGHLRISTFVDPEYAEGTALLRSHLVRERDRSLRALKLQDTPAPVCEACDHDPAKMYGSLRSIEVHHAKEVKHGPRKTKLENLHLLCANCHRAIHALNPMPPVAKFRNLLFSRS